MIDEPLVPEPPRTASARTPWIIGGGAFLGGMLLTTALFETWPRPNPDAGPVAPPALQQPDPRAAASLPPNTDLATLSAREQELAARLDRLAERIRNTDGAARNAAAYAGRAEGLMIAFAARRTLDRGQPLGPLEVQLRERFGESNPEAVAAIARASAEPVTLEDLRLALDTITPRLMSGPSDGLWTGARRLLTDLVVLREADAPSPRPADRLRRARRALAAGQVEAALAEVGHLPGAASADSWVAAARRYAAAREGLAEIERAAVAPLPASTLPPASPPRTSEI